MKKAIFFSLGLTMFAFVVLTLSLIFAENASRYDNRFAELASINRIYDLDTSLQKAISKLFSLDSGMTYTASYTEAVFQQDFPLNFTELNASYNTFRNFIIIREKNIAIDTLSSNVSLKVSPQGILYWQNLSRNSSHFSSNNQKPTSYYFIIDFLELNITGCSSSSFSGNFSFSVAAVGGNGSSCNMTLSVNPDQYSSATVSAGSKNVVAEISNYSAAVIAGSSKIYSTSRVRYADMDGILEIIGLTTHVNITIPGLIAKKYGEIRIT